MTANPSDIHKMILDLEDENFDEGTGNYSENFLTTSKNF
jgi:hypothetical protein